MVLAKAPIRHSHLQLHLGILECFTKKTLMNTQHLNFMSLAILLDNPTSLVSKSSKIKFACQIKIYLYTPIPIFVNTIRSCCLRPSSTYVTYLGVIRHGSLGYRIFIEMHMRLMVWLVNM